MATPGTTPASSLRTEDEYSFLQGPSIQTPPYLCEASKGQYSGSDELPSSPISNGSIGENEHLITSYHALQTAYDHMKRRFSETVEIKNSLQRRVKALSAGNSMDRSTPTVQQIAASHESEVAKAWEAYSDKCKECEKLRDDLRAAEQKAIKNQIDARDMSMREDMMRAKSQQDEYKKQLQQAEMEIRDHKDKLEMAREELEKEKEYLNMLREKAEERHNEMEATIEMLRQELQNEKRKNQEFIKDLEKQRQNAQDAMDKQESAHKEEIRKIEERLYHEQDERSLAQRRILEMERALQSTGLPLSLPAVHQKRLDFDLDSNSSLSDVDAAELMTELRSITEEIASLKQKTSSQTALINQLYDDPKIQESLSLCNGFDISESINVFQPPPSQFTLMSRSSDGSSTQPTMDTRQLISDKSSVSSGNQSMKPTCDGSLGVPSSFAISRQIHSVEASSLDEKTSDRNSPQKIEIPQLPLNLSDAFTNINLHKVSGDLLQPVSTNDVPDAPTSFYSALAETAGPLGDASHVTMTQKTIHASQSSDSTNDTLVEESTNNADGEECRYVPPPVVVDRPPLRYPTPNYGNQPAAGFRMQPLWPSAGKNVAGSQTPLWPPGSSLGNHSSFDIIPEPSDSSLESGKDQSLVRIKGNQEYAEFLQKTGAREFRVQQINRPRDPSYPPTQANNHLKHPSAIPSNRARSGDFNQQVASPNSSVLVRRRADLRPSAVEQEEDDDKAFMAAPDNRECPVCHELFPSNATESSMLLHINNHFSDDEMETSPMS